MIEAELEFKFQEVAIRCDLVDKQPISDFKVKIIGDTLKEIKAKTLQFLTEHMQIVELNNKSYYYDSMTRLYNNMIKFLSNEDFVYMNSYNSSFEPCMFLNFNVTYDLCIGEK